MGSTTSIHNDYDDRHVVSFVGVNVAGVIIGSTIVLLATAGAGALVYLGAGGAAAGAAAIGTTLVVAIEPEIAEAAVELVETLGKEPFFEGTTGIFDIDIPGLANSMTFATFSGMSESGRQEYTTKLLQAGYATDEDKRTPGMRRLLEETDLLKQKKFAQDYQATIGGEILNPGQKRKYGGILSLVRTSYQYTFSCKNGVVTSQKGSMTVWTGLTNKSDITYKVSDHNLKDWDGK